MPNPHQHAQFTKTFYGSFYHITYILLILSNKIDKKKKDIYYFITFFLILGSKNMYLFNDIIQNR